MSTATKLNRILTTKSDLKTALVNKGQNVTDETPFKNYASYIANLDNTSDANAVASDLARGKTAYVNGQKVTGDVLTISGSQLELGVDSVNYSSNTNNLLSIHLMNANTLFKDDSAIGLKCAGSDVASAISLTANKIKKDTTILGITGTYEGTTINNQNKTVTPTTSQQSITADNGYTGLNTVIVNAVTSAIDNNITASNIKNGITILGVTGSYEGTDTSDATAVAGDLAKDKTAYVDGQKVTGTVDFIASNRSATYTPVNASYNSDTNRLRATYTFSGNKGFRDSSVINLDMTGATVATQIGLSADKIKKDVTILGITGTVDPGLDTSDATATASDIAEGMTAYVNGQKVTGTVPFIEAGYSMSTTITRINYHHNQLDFGSKFSSDEGFRRNSVMEISATDSQVASAISLTANKIAQGQTVLGVTGTYDGGVSAALSASY